MRHYLGTPVSWGHRKNRFTSHQSGSYKNGKWPKQEGWGGLGRGGVGWVGEGWVTNWTSRPAEKPQAVRLFVFWGKLKNYLVSDVYTLTDTDERNTNLGFFKATPQVSSLLRNGNVSSQNNTRTSLVWTLHTNFPFRSRLVHQVGTHLPFRPPTVWNTCSMPPFIHPETQ